MLQRYIKSALRNISRHKFYSCLNILGLATGLAASFLIGLYIYHELTFDRFHKDYGNIYHVGMHINFGGQEIITSSSCPPLAQALVAGMTGIEEATRINPWPVQNLLIRNEDKTFSEDKAFLADSNFFEFFSFQLLQGDPKHVLKEPHTIVLADHAAKQYFGNEPAIGKTLIVGNENETYTVTGVAVSPPANSHIQFDALISYSSSPTTRDGWGSVDGTYTYFKKTPSTPIGSVTAALRAMVKLQVSPELEATFGMTLQEFEKQGGVYTFFPYALSESHLFHPEITDGTSPSGDIRYIYITGATGIFILLIACINFMNLSTAHSMKRAREVGLRKAFGSDRTTLVFQFLSESFVSVFMATVLALVATYLLLPYFNLLSGKTLSFNTLLLPEIILSICLIFLFVSLLSGSYPAFYLTSFKPVDVLKGKASTGMRSKGIRSTLVVVQFSISIALMICTVMVFSQLNYMRNMNVGFDKQNVLIIKNTQRLGNNYAAFLEAVNNLAGVVKASYADNAFPEVNRASTFREAGATKDVVFQVYTADYNHLEVLKINLSQGRYFSPLIASDAQACVINEAAAKAMGWTDALNSKFQTDGGGSSIPVIGVIRDFHFESFKSTVRPLVVFFKTHADFMHIRYDGNVRDVIASVEKTWKQYALHSPYDYSFLDENFDQLFREEERLSKLSTVMSGVAIFVACLGLLGLAAFTAEQRTREIGIRKALGASILSIHHMLSKEFMALVGIAFVVACVLGWYGMDTWLSSFAYHIDLDPAVFLLSGILAAFIAWLTVGYHFIKAARSNPCDAIRYE
ncbi:ABC transporter permease [Chryseolinea sp. H1M3-3]|uniref:ABC transporter permease n=1 Tax=Chryseolinea sp. H1M3-3 TaxID=3034144 RepID=UPI0023EA7EEA|nr:ABC transporter permease [Chryseolinea sp. H1M3-3]